MLLQDDDEYEEHVDDGDADFENEEHVVVQEQLRRPDLEKATGGLTKKGGHLKEDGRRTGMRKFSF